MMGKKEYQPKLMYMVTLEDLVPGDNFYRQLDKFLDLRFLYQECESIYGTTGNPSIDPAAFFKLNLFGYFENIISDRELVRRASDSLAVRLYLRYDLDEELPWHSTVSRTRAIMPEGVFDSLFQRVLQMCVELGFVSGEHQSIDSTLVKANASLESLEKRKPQLELTQYIEKTRTENTIEPVAGENELILPKQDDEAVFPIEKSKGKNAGEEKQQNNSEGFFGQETLQYLTAKEIKVAKGKQEKRKRSNKEYRSKTDPDSKIARKPGKPTDLYYSTHYSVDSKGRIITDVYTTTAEKTDADILLEVVQRTEERLSEFGLKISSVGADKNYCSGENLRQLEQEGKTPYIATQKHPNTTGGIESTEFRYNKEDDKYICPMGKELKYEYTNKKKGRVYRAAAKDCSECSLKDKCIPKGKRRRVQHSLYKEEYERLLARSKTSVWKQKQRIRKITTEGSFAEAKMKHGLSKFMSRGRDKAQKRSLMIATVQNLKRMMRVFGNKYLKASEKFSELVFSLNKDITADILKFFEMVFPLRLLTKGIYDK